MIFSLTAEIQKLKNKTSFDDWPPEPYIKLIRETRKILVLDEPGDHSGYPEKDLSEVRIYFDRVRRYKLYLIDKDIESLKRRVERTGNAFI